jgi:hypothetical protein
MDDPDVRRRRICRLWFVERLAFLPFRAHRLRWSLAFHRRQARRLAAPLRFCPCLPSPLQSEPLHQRTTLSTLLHQTSHNRRSGCGSCTSSTWSSSGRGAPRIAAALGLGLRGSRLSKSSTISMSNRWSNRGLRCLTHDARPLAPGPCYTIGTCHCFGKERACRWHAIDQSLFRRAWMDAESCESARVHARTCI